MKAGSILEKLFTDQPNHPGIAHYIIHSYDNPVLAEKALPTARKYASIAPGSAHAQHMPSHIFTRLGLWDESIHSNLNSVSSAVCYAQEAGFQAPWDEEMHGLDYLVYAYLQMGENDKATAQKLYLDTIQKIYPTNFKVAYALAAIPARIVLENKDWETAANLQPSSINLSWENYPWQESILHFARTLGASHTQKLDQAQSEIAKMEILYDQLVAAKNQYQSNQVMIQIKAAKAWLMFAEGKKEDAIALMTEAATMEDQTEKHPVTPSEVIPARELLADLLLAANKPREALQAYENDLRNHPRGLNGLFGAGEAAKMMGDQAKALEYFKQLWSQVGPSTSNRSEILAVKKYLNLS